jgi:hypothetical protein
MVMLDIEILQMALIGYEAQRRKIEEKIAEIQSQLGGRARPAASRKAEKPAPKPAAKRRKLSPAAKAKLVANLVKARAAKAAKRKVA